MKKVKILLSIVTLFFMGWALMEQYEEHPKIWVQVIGVGLFFYSMMRLMQKTPSNTHNRQHPFEERDLNGEEIEESETLDKKEDAK